jgi:hypothetical protein
MRRLRSLTAQSPAIAIALVALVFSLGSGAGYAASTVAAQPTRVTFRALHLRHGWESQFGTIRAGKPAFGVNGSGVVYLSGDLDLKGGHNTGAKGEFAVLPKSVRPSHQLDLTVTTVAGTTAVMQITPDGVMFIFGDNAAQFTSLDGISYPLDR